MCHRFGQAPCEAVTIINVILIDNLCMFPADLSVAVINKSSFSANCQHKHSRARVYDCTLSVLIIFCFLLFSINCSSGDIMCTSPFVFLVGIFLSMRTLSHVEVDLLFVSISISNIDAIKLD